MTSRTFSGAVVSWCFHLCFSNSMVCGTDGRDCFDLGNLQMGERGESG